MKLEIAKGTREIEPKEKIVMNYIIEVIKRNFELYGFSPIETPILQRIDVLASKYAGGAEILKEIFKLNDQGERELALRYDLTVPLGIYIALNPNIKLPFKRYEIGKVFRDGPVSTERFREFWQCDADVVGSASMVTDAELMDLGLKTFRDLNLSVDIRVNNIKILKGIILSANISDDKISSTILIIEKLKKIGVDGVKKELKESGLNSIQIDSVLSALLIDGTNSEKLNKLKLILKDNEGIKEMEKLIDYVPQINFDASLARGLSYYTGTIFEVGLLNSKIKTTICSGGRYDNMIGDFIDNNQKYPAVGISFGLDRIYQVVEFDQKATAKVYVIPINTLKESLSLARELRYNKINTSIDLMSRGISKNLDYANALGIPYVIFVGDNEIKEGKFKLKNMVSGNEEMLKIKDIINTLKD